MIRGRLTISGAITLDDHAGTVVLNVTIPNVDAMSAEDRDFVGGILAIFAGEDLPAPTVAPRARPVVFDGADQPIYRTGTTIHRAAQGLNPLGVTGRRLLRTLADLGGAIKDPSGYAGARLFDTTSIDYPNGRKYLKALDDAGHVGRSLRGTRCYSVWLTVEGWRALGIEPPDDSDFVADIADATPLEEADAFDGPTGDYLGTVTEVVATASLNGDTVTASIPVDLDPDDVDGITEAARQVIDRIEDPIAETTRRAVLGLPQQVSCPRCPHILPFLSPVALRIHEQATHPDETDPA